MRANGWRTTFQKTTTQTSVFLSNLRENLETKCFLKMTFQSFYISTFFDPFQPRSSQSVQNVRFQVEARPNSEKYQTLPRRRGVAFTFRRSGCLLLPVRSPEENHSLSDESSGIHWRLSGIWLLCSGFGRKNQKIEAKINTNQWLVFLKPQISQQTHCNSWFCHFDTLRFNSLIWFSSAFHRISEVTNNEDDWSKGANELVLGNEELKQSQRRKRMVFPTDPRLWQVRKLLFIKSLVFVGLSWHKPNVHCYTNFPPAARLWRFVPEIT